LAYIFVKRLLSEVTGFKFLVGNSDLTDELDNGVMQKNLIDRGFRKRNVFVLPRVLAKRDF